MKYEALNNHLIQPTLNKNMLNMILVLYKQLKYNSLFFLSYFSYNQSTNNDEERTTND